MNNLEYILAKGEENGGLPLIRHLSEVALLAEKVAIQLDLDVNTARRGAILHDIGKVSTVFQRTLKKGFLRPPGFLFRHELASLFFISLLGKEEKYPIIDMVVAHHKSIAQDAGGKGILDLIDYDPEILEKHLIDFESWSKDALMILKYLGFNIHLITREEAKNNFYEVVDYCETRGYGYSVWKGVLMAADHLASALNSDIEVVSNKLFIKPDLNYYHTRKSELYPLSFVSSNDKRKHTLVTAPTGAGKTDFLFRRCTGRVFYTLPFQASINAMYERVKAELKNTGAQVRLLHAASSLKVEKHDIEEKILQRHIGASVKILTPHQMASLAFGTKGYEAMIVDLKDCDVILDEIHTYSETTQAIVLKIVEILDSIGCHIHIGTATMPSELYSRLVAILGGKEKVYEVQLKEAVLDSFDRHIIHKVDSINDLDKVIEVGIANKQKILLVCNQVKRAQSLYEYLDEKYPNTDKMLVHSRFKRSRRAQLESDLKNVYNEFSKACLVVSTQVVEVSLDISFDLMITECAPIDALIQRFGRINRKRTKETIGKYKPIYVLAPSENKSEALPYDMDILKLTYNILPNAELMKERHVQQMIDSVYTDNRFVDIDIHSAFKKEQWQLKELWHNPKSALLEMLDIDSVTCINEVDKEKYENGSYEEQAKLEIPVSYRTVAFAGLDKSEAGSHPFVIPSKAYDEILGFLSEYAKPNFYDVTTRFL